MNSIINTFNLSGLNLLKQKKIEKRDDFGITTQVY